LLGFLRLQSAILERNAAKLDAAKLAAAWRTWLTGNIDTHVCGIVRVLVGSVSLVAGRLREVSEGVGNSVEEGAISAKRGGTGRAISSFAEGCLTRDQAFINFNKPHTMARSCTDVYSLLNHLLNNRQIFTDAISIICASNSTMCIDRLCRSLMGNARTLSLSCSVGKGV
jgi:hypothetical protein